MPLHNGRGDGAKEAILNAYELTPISHTLVPWKELRCCCGDAISSGNRYHLFRANPRPGNPLPIDHLYAGDYCARSFVHLDPSIRLLPLADPFALLAVGGDGAPRRGRANHDGERVVMHPLAREIATAHAILVLYFGVSKPGGPLDHLATELAKLGVDRPRNSMVRTINTIARKLGGLPLLWLQLRTRFSRHSPQPGFPLMGEILGEDNWLQEPPQ